MRESASRPYAPLGVRTLCVHAVVLVAAEIVLFRSYRIHEAGFHWATHFLVALAAAALVQAAWLLVTSTPARGQLAAILALHLYAMAPDLLFQLGVPHERWMDLFLAHVSAHAIPGGDETWLVIALAASGLYAALLAAWLSARRREARAGMAPGIGIGGIAVVSPQADPATTELAHVHAGSPRPPDVLLLHGLGGSSAVWRPVADELAAVEKSVIVPDLLGFGASRRIGTRFGLDDQVRALERLLEGHDAAPLVVAAHSWGCAVAVALAARTPARVEQLVLVSPPVFLDPQVARARIAARGWLARQTVEERPAADFACGLMCLARGLLVRALPRLSRDLPAEVAADSVQHSWPAYRDALRSLLVDNPLDDALASPRRPTMVVVSDADTTAPATDVNVQRYQRVRIVELQGNHLLPLSRATEIAALIVGEAGRVTDNRA